jgi:NhaP-type Na+/H+ or K+/H+ antiporter
VTLQLAGIFILGILAQWAAWRLRIPSILLLLAASVAAGPVLGLIQPDHLLGPLLLPAVSLAVAVILYEGGLNLRVKELRTQRIHGVFLRLVTIGVLLSWALGSVAARFLLGLDWPVSVLLGAILVVTGPTVIGPMLRHLRLRGRTASLLQWEGIVVDPLGAILAVMTFTVLRSGELRAGIGAAVAAFASTLAAGVAFGLAAGAMLVVALRRFSVPDRLHNPVSLMLMFAAFAGANTVQQEAGLLAATVMGMALANQPWVGLRHVVEFKETLTVLLISVLFVTLAARLDLRDLRGLGWESLAFAAAMIFGVRPLSMVAATMGTTLAWRERAFLSWMAPRGIVAAAVASVFALDLASMGYPRGLQLVPVTFLLVFVTVSVYGLSAGPLARSFGLAQANPQGILFVGAHGWARAMARALLSEECTVLLIDTNWEDVRACRMVGLPCVYGSALAERTREEIDFSGLGRLLAVTSNNEVNALACVRYIEDFGRKEVYQLPIPAGNMGRHEDMPRELRGRILFGKEWTFAKLTAACGDDPQIRRTKLTQEFDYPAFCAGHGAGALLLFVRRPNGSVIVCTAEESIQPQPGDTLIWHAIGSQHQSPSEGPRETPEPDGRAEQS